jgi:hypothetical protein
MTTNGPVVLGRSNGESFDLLTQVGNLTQRELATALAREPRCGGHTNRWWSVADHSVFCYETALHLLSDPKEQLSVLLHDLTEGTGLKDMPRPIKKLLPEYADLEAKVLAQLERRWGFSLAFEAVHEIDRNAFYVEAYYLQGRVFPELADVPHMMHKLFLSYQRATHAGPADFEWRWREAALMAKAPTT